VPSLTVVAPMKSFIINATLFVMMSAIFYAIWLVFPDIFGAGRLLNELGWLSSRHFQPFKL
jgi:hypothetical protein